MNKPSAKIWIVKSWHYLSGAKLLNEANHYTDVTAVEIHYAVEKYLKAFLAYENKKIPKTHNLNEIYNLIKDFIQLTDYELDLLDIISEYHIEESSPMPDRTLPPKDEIEEVLDFTETLFHKVCNILKIDIKEEIK